MIPEQDIAPWADAVESITGDRAVYEAEAERSRAVALEFVSRLDAADFERLLLSLKPAPRRPPVDAGTAGDPRAAAARTRSGVSANPAGAQLAVLSVARRRRQIQPAADGGAGGSRTRVRVVSRVEKFGAEAHRKLLNDLHRARFTIASDSSVRFRSTASTSHADARLQPPRLLFRADSTSSIPTSSSPRPTIPAQLLFDIAVRAPRARVVHLVRATIAVPFGPDSSSPTRAKTETLRGADAIVGVSEYVAAYVREWGGMDAVHVPISLMESGTHLRRSGLFDNPFVTMVNPCAVKGIDIFVALAARLPHLQFAAVPTWGTNAQDLAALRSRPNITLLDPVDNIDDLLRRTRVVLVPSVWAEARSRIVVEAMLRGVPVIASDAGGIREAKLGVPYLIPVNLIRALQARARREPGARRRDAAAEHRSLGSRRSRDSPKIARTGRRLRRDREKPRCAMSRLCRSNPSNGCCSMFLKRPKTSTARAAGLRFAAAIGGVAVEAAGAHRGFRRSRIPRRRARCVSSVFRMQAVARGSIAAGRSKASRSVRCCCRVARAARRNLPSTTCRS